MGIVRRLLTRQVHFYWIYGQRFGRLSSNMLKGTILIVLSMAIGIQSLSCPERDQRRIRDCVREATVSKFGQRYWNNDDYDRCEHLEMGIKCAQDINPECAKDAYFVFAKAFGHAMFRPDGPAEISANEPCIHQRFDEYFNQNGMCSYQDGQEIYKCTDEKWREVNGQPTDHWSCKGAKVTEYCIKEGHKSCMGFFKEQLPIFVQGEFHGREDVPECMNPYLTSNEVDDEDQDDQAEKFPTFNKLVNELVLIKRLLNEL